MRGSRAPRGLTRKSGTIEGENVTGNPSGTSTAWGGGDPGVSTPGIGDYPTLTIVVDDNDDGTDEVQSNASSRAGRRTADDSTKSRLRTQFQTLLNFIAWMMDLAAGIRSFKNIVVDGTGGEAVVGDAGSISASGDGIFGGDMEVGGTVTIGGRVQARMIASALINGGTSLLGSVGLDVSTPFTHSGTGSYSLKLASAVADETKLVVHVTLSTVRGFAEGVAIDTQHIAVGTYNTSDVAIDTTCSVTVFEVL